MTNKHTQAARDDILSAKIRQDYSLYRHCQEGAKASQYARSAGEYPIEIVWGFIARSVNETYLDHIGQPRGQRP